MMMEISPGMQNIYCNLIKSDFIPKMNQGEYDH
jgi:hypothetical protein